MASLVVGKENGFIAEKARALAGAFAAAALLVAPLLGAEACSLGNLTPDHCTQSSECTGVFGVGSECVNGFCTEAVKCVVDADCQEGTCRGGYCSVGSCEGTVNGRPCHACAPEKREEFLNACTNATCEPFDASRVTKLPQDGKLPPLP